MIHYGLWLQLCVICCAFGVIFIYISSFSVCAFKLEVHNHMLESVEGVLCVFCPCKVCFCIVQWCLTPVLLSQAMNPSVCENSNHNREFDFSLDVRFVCQHVLLSQLRAYLSHVPQSLSQNIVTSPRSCDLWLCRGYFNINRHLITDTHICL